MKNKLITLITFLIVILIWYFASLNSNSLFIPNPLVVLEDAKTLISTGQLQIAILYTFRRILISSVLSGLVALPLGLLVYNFKIIKYSVNPMSVLCDMFQ